MKAENITKLYRGLTNHELASLAFDYAVKDDSLECVRIAESVDVADYRCTNFAYRNRLTDIFTVASTYGMIYWQGYSSLLASMAMTYAITAEMTDECIVEAADRVIMMKRHVVATDHALTQICEEYGLTRENILKYAGIDEHGDMFNDISPDVETLAQTMRHLRGILTR
jgi:DNA-binding phage protein